MMATRHGFGAALMACVVLLGCGRNDKPKAASPEPEVERTWKRHETVIERAVQHHEYTENDLLAAVSFFEKTTGIKSPRGLDETGLAVVPTKELGTDLERWRAWYAANGRSLYVDSATGEVRQRPREGR